MALVLKTLARALLLPTLLLPAPAFSAIVWREKAWGLDQRLLFGGQDYELVFLAPMVASRVTLRVGGLG